VDEVSFEALVEAINECGFDLPPVSLQHGLIAGALPAHHHDPFDRMFMRSVRQRACGWFRV